MIRFTLIGSCVLAVGLIAGCESDSKPVSAPPVHAAEQAPPDTGAPQPNGMDLFRGALVQSQQQIEATLASLKDVTDPGQQDLRGAYNKYCDNLARMQENEDTLRHEYEGMRDSRNEYFTNWEDKVSSIDNPTIRASAEARRQRLQNAHQQIVTAAGDAKDAYVPFMKDLQDIKKYLAADLSKPSIADLVDAAKKVQADGADVNDKLGVIVKTLDSVQGG
jgi:Protein of unknown function (DUF2959)